MFSFEFFVNSVLFGIGLAMDAFSVSLANGLNDPKMRKKRMFLIAGTFGIFQTLMPLIGWICVKTVADTFTVFGYFVPIIALLLLLYIGGKMIIEGIKAGGGDEKTAISFKELIVQGVATSIDALSVGLTIENLSFLPALVETLIIGLVTTAICVFGLVIGRKFGTRLSRYASILGGVILCAIGVEIFVTGFSNVKSAFDFVISLF